MAVLVGAPAPAIAAAPEYSLEERAKAITTPSLVFLETLYEGQFQDEVTGKPLSDTPVVASFRCSGFVVSAAGWVVTSGRCVQPTAESVVWAAAYTLASDKLSKKEIAPNQLDSYAARVVDTALFSDLSGDPVVRGKLHGQLGIGTGGQQQAPAIKGEVLADRKLNEGDVALVKLEAENLPVVLADNFEINPSSGYFIAGYGTNDTNARGGTYTVRTKPSKIVGVDKSGAAPRYRMDTDLGGYSHGGPVFDAAGRVVGMINGNPRGDRLNRLITDSATIKSLLDSVNVANALSPGDQAYRAGLNAYFGGRYAEAVEQFDKTLAASPANKSAASYRQQAAERLAVEGDAGSGDSANPLLNPVVLALAAVLLLGLVGVVVYLATRRRRRVAHPYEGLMPISAGPWAPTSAQPYSAPPGTWWGQTAGEHPAVMIPAPEHVPTPQPPAPADAYQVPPPPPIPAPPATWSGGDDSGPPTEPLPPRA
ncbi:trypsin-like peptidase domain-containing protein [Catellatospora sp. NPDC049609]|uniref:trypsin-like peptidase domain-containing protein n=1 Tax=Catellatospora sp. NPDC049609 TaxID=3155505 RepID=UPI0034127D15